MTLDLDRRLAAGVRDGSIGQRRRPDYRWNWAGWAAVVATAASLACVLVIAPRPVGPAIEGRGQDDVRFLRPVEGEVVPSGGLQLAWTEISGAESYQIRITDLQDGSSRQETTSASKLVLESEKSSGGGGAYRVLLSTVPADLIPVGGVSVTFRTGNQFSVFYHRVKWAQPVAYLLVLLGLVLGVLFVAGRWTQSRSEMSG